MRWLSITAVYGYFISQATLLIGMPPPLYETLLRFLGLLLTGLLMLLILQNRQSVAQYIRGMDVTEAGGLHPRHILRRLAPVWHIVAIIYILMLYGIWALALTSGFLFILKGTLLTALILIVGNAILWFIEQAFRHGFQFGDAMTREFAYFVFDVGVSYQEDIDAVMDELAAIGQEMMRDPRYAPLILEPLEILGVDSFASAVVMIKARIKTLPIKQWEVGREFNRRMKKRFDQLAIEMSLPRLTVYMERNRKGRVSPGNSQNNEGENDD